MWVVLFITKSFAVNKNKQLLSTPDNSNHLGKYKKSSSYRGLNCIENDLKGNEHCFKLARGSSYW